MNNLYLASSLSLQDKKWVQVIGRKPKVALLHRGLDFKFSSFLVGEVEVSKKTFLLAYPANWDKKALKTKLTPGLDEVILATVLLPGEVLGVNFKIKEFTAEGIICHFPEHYYEINRRATKRWEIAPELYNSLYLEITIPISSSPIIVPLNDLSPLGLNFKVPKYLHAFFSLGQIFPRASLRLGVKNIPMTLEVRNISNHNETKYPKKVGARFFKINPEHQVEILKFLQQNCKATG